MQKRGMAGGVITLGDMRAKGVTMLEVACDRCERRGRLRIERLIAEHGSRVLDLCAIIAADCPRMQNPSTSICDRCVVHFPQLRSLFNSAGYATRLSRSSIIVRQR